MSNFKITIELDKNFQLIKHYNIIYLKREEKKYYDNLAITNNILIISGTRTDKIAHSKILETKQSTYYMAIVKSLLYLYFTHQQSFTICNITIYIDEVKSEIYSSDKIIQVFSNMPKLKIDCSILFSDEKNKSEKITIALMNLTLSYFEENSSFDYTWKCFNLIIREIFNKKKDKELLIELRKDLENFTGDYSDTISYFEKMDLQFIRSFYFKEMIKNDLKSENEIKLFFYDFDDYMVCTVLNDLIYIFKDDFKDANVFNAVISKYNYNIENCISKTTDIIRLLLLKYAYYLRCKYFHAEKRPSNFLIINKNLEELIKLSLPLSIICKDLLKKFININKPNEID